MQENRSTGHKLVVKNASSHSHIKVSAILMSFGDLSDSLNNLSIEEHSTDSHISQSIINHNIEMNLSIISQFKMPGAETSITILSKIQVSKKNKKHVAILPNVLAYSF